MFLKSSRYHELDTVAVLDRSGRKVKAVKLRRLPLISGDITSVADSDQLDVVSETNYKDATRFWHIADANSELEAGELMRIAGRIIRVPRR